MVTHVTALVVTYQRPPILATALNAIQGQTRRPDEIVVVDNDPAGSARAVADRAGVTYVAAGVNGGYASGIAVGMEHMAGSTDVFWILDDDTYPAADALALMLEHLTDGVGVVGNRGGHFRRGRIRYDLRHPRAGVVADADFTLVDGAVVRADAVAAAGPLRSDFFMMMEDFEFTTRVKSAGFRLVVVGGDASTHEHLGSTAPWRAYHQARNYLRIGIERRSPRDLYGWTIREAATWLHLLRTRDLERLKFRARGTVDGLLGRMGVRH